MLVVWENVEAGSGKRIGDRRAFATGAVALLGTRRINTLSSTIAGRVSSFKLPRRVTSGIWEGAAGDNPPNQLPPVQANAVRVRRRLCSASYSRSYHEEPELLERADVGSSVPNVQIGTKWRICRPALESWRSNRPTPQRWTSESNIGGSDEPTMAGCG